MTPVPTNLRARATRAFLRANSFVWRLLPRRLVATRPMMAYGRRMQRVVRANSDRSQNPRTYFLRNRPELDVIASLFEGLPEGAEVKITVLAASMGAEPYSVLWTLRQKRPDLSVHMHAIDILPEVIEVAREGWWDADTDHLERMSPAEIDDMFDREGTRLRVKQWLRDAIEFEVGDGTDPAKIEALGPQDLVLANRFLTHMHPPQAEAALRRIVQLVAPGGHLVCTGVDVDVRTRVLASLGWKPVTDRIEELHDGDYTQGDLWPWEYWALEPIDKGLPDWQLRYATVFHRPR